MSSKTKLYWLRLPLGRGFIYTPPIPIDDPVAKSSGIAQSIARYGERKWAELAKHPPNTIRGYVYRLGCTLISRIPVTETLLWRIHHHIQQTAHDDRLFHSGRLLLRVPFGPTLDPLAMGSLLHQEIRPTLVHLQQLHRRRQIGYGLLVIPGIILSIFPFVKLALGWVVFRWFGHAKAYYGCSWLVSRIDTNVVDLTPDPDLYAAIRGQDSQARGSDGRFGELIKIFNTLSNKFK